MKVLTRSIAPIGIAFLFISAPVNIQAEAYTKSAIKGVHAISLIHMLKKDLKA